MSERDAVGVRAPPAVFHMEDHWDANGTQMVDSIRKNVGSPRIEVVRLPWTLMRLLSPLVPLFRDLAEMHYLWNTPVRMDNVWCPSSAPSRIRPWPWLSGPLCSASVARMVRETRIAHRNLVFSGISTCEAVE